MQKSFADIEYLNRRRRTKRDKLLDAADRAIPWDECVRAIAPFYPSARFGRPAIGIETMLRMLVLQKIFGLSDSGIEEAIYDSYSMSRFMRINFIEEQAPAASTLYRFKARLVKHGLDKEVNEAIDKALSGIV